MNPTPAAANLNMLGKVCIVTGAASGIGRAIARQLAANGAVVVIADVTETVIEGGVATARLITEAGQRGWFIATDVTDGAQVDALIQATVERFGRLDVLVNNACIRHARPLLELNEADWQRVLDVNLGGVYRCLPRRGPADAPAGTGRRGARADHQSVFAARHDRRAPGPSLWRQQGRH
jgi:NAD(P)-dependent dehydrogenase (short-subunit alcohol dehydrogenase family)